MARLTLILGVLATVVYLLDGFRFMLNEWRNWRNKGKWIVVAVLCLLPSVAEAACGGSSPTLIPASLNNTAAMPDISDCTTAAVDGDTILLPAGTATWTQIVGWGDKKINMIGAGQGVTIINTGLVNNFFIGMTTSGVHTWRLAHFTLNVTQTDSLIHIACSTACETAPATGWRIDHITITNTGASAGYAVFFEGFMYGLVDHVTMNGDVFFGFIQYGYTFAASEAANCVPHCFGYNMWNRNLTLGTDEAIYIEDSVFDFPSAAVDKALNDMVYGGAMVIRYNIVNGLYVQTHSSRSNEHGGMKYEVYNNTFTGAAVSTRWGLIRSGTGVIFNNTVTAYGSNTISIDGQRENTNVSCIVNVAPLGICNGANSYDGNTEASGWPCLGAVGRGAVSGFAENGGNQSSTPLYLWKCGSESTCATGGTCTNTSVLALNVACGASLADYLKTTGSTHGGGEVDYVNNGDTPKPGYTAYTYPHPLQGITTTPATTPAVVARIIRFMEVAAFVTGMGWHFRKQVMAVSLAALAGCGTLIQLAPRSYDTVKTVSKDSAVKVLTVFNDLTKPRS